jgi:hypothetical protein
MPWLKSALGYPTRVDVKHTCLLHQKQKYFNYFLFYWPKVIFFSSSCSNKSIALGYSSPRALLCNK